MNSVDKQYLDILRDIMENGSDKMTRSGEVRSVFGRTMRFNLKDGLPLLTTKKVFVKGIIHELLWFLNGDTNIKYLVENNVHIWDDDAYRYYLELVKKHNEFCLKRDEAVSASEHVTYFYDRMDEKNPVLENNESDEWIDYADSLIDTLGGNLTMIEPLDKTSFLTKVLNEDIEPMICDIYTYPHDGGYDFNLFDYRYGEMGKIYGHQWRSQGVDKIDQIQDIIDMLKTNPDDRRMICMAWNRGDFDEMGLPPCHYGFQVYTRELSEEERWKIFKEKFLEPSDEEGYFNLMTTRDEHYIKGSLAPYLNRKGVPSRELSLSFNMRSNDFCCGNPYNICQYSLLAYMLCEVCNMVPGELIYNGGDVHIYKNHFDGVNEQLSRQGSDILPTLSFARKHDNINDFTYEDFIIENYHPEPPIKYQLNVGL